jgi:small-conductance mechanosensitive channel
MSNLTQTLILVATASFVLGVILYGIHSFFKRFVVGRVAEDPEFDPTFLYFIKRITELVVLIFGILLILQNVGVQVSALIGGLGISGIAIAFAVQNVLKDIFSSVSIYFDRPFRLGDRIQIGSDSGTVQKIGLKSTRLLTLQGEELIISNKELTDSRVLNFRNVKQRRVVFELNISPATSPAKLKKIPHILSELINPVPNVRFGRAHLKTITGKSLVFEVVYHVMSDGYGVYMDAHQTIMLGVLTELAAQKIAIEFS